MSFITRHAFPLFLAATLLFTPVAEAETSHTTARLFSAQTATGETGSVEAGLDITIEDGWKIYWRTPGDAGLAPAFDWTGSQNLAGTDIKWPAPHRFITADIDNIGYKKHVTLPVIINLQDAAQPLEISLKLDLLVCSDICVPETKKLTLSLPAGVANASADRALFDAALKTLPQKETAGFVFNKAYIDVDDENRRLLIVEAVSEQAPAKEDDLFIEHDSGTTFGKAAFEYNTGTKQLLIRTEIHSTSPLEKVAGELNVGQLRLTYVGANEAFEGAIKLGPKTADDVGAAGVTVAERLAAFDLRLILLSLLGGLILNLMPCVLPVLSLKVLSVVSHGGKDNRFDIFKNFMASALGIIASFWLMAGALSALKNAGGSVGWGIQFQHPAFLTFLFVLLLGFSANLWGFFEIQLPRFIANRAGAKAADEPTFAGHFLTGAFATLLATPCTAPFLGTAIGFALARGTLEIFIIFTLLGVGLALPYIALAFSPRLFKYMPKPGKWMIKLKKLLAIALFVTALWLGNILLSVTTGPALDSGWQVFAEEKIAPAVEDGKIVVVDVTADWCLTCKANKKLVLEQKAVKDILTADNILLLQADWTKRDETIAAYLKKYGRYGIPFNIVYGPAAPEGIPLPELLTKEAITGALAEAAGE